MSTVEKQHKNRTPLESKQLEMLISSIVEVTKQRDRLALEDCFSRLISLLTGAQTLTIYHLQPNGTETLVVPVLHLAGGINVTPSNAKIKSFFLSSNAQITDALTKPYVSGSGQIEGELILPLQGMQGDISAYCRLVNASDDDSTRRILPLLLEFYMNFLALLDDNERDALTGLLNRKTFDGRIAKIQATLKSQQQRSADKAEKIEFCLASLDIDHFKSINDTYGHIFGDEVLLLFSNIMKSTFRDNDLLFRFGGEEFVVLLANAGIAHAQIALEHFRHAIEQHNFPQVRHVTVSIGVATISFDELPRTTIDCADQALYYAKQNGRNQVRVYEELLEQGLLKIQKIQTGDIELF